MFKKGISTIIGIVLIILLVIGGVFIIWGSINPVIEESSDIEIDRNDLIIVSEQGYTVYEPKDPKNPSGPTNSTFIIFLLVLLSMYI